MLTLKGTQVLETPRLVLRPFAERDGEAIYRNWASDPEVARYVTWNAHQSVDESRELCHIWIKEGENPQCFQWAIELKEIGEAIGSISVVEWNAESGVAEVGYAIGRAFWRKGITSEACRELCRYLFEECGFKRVTACHDAGNPASGRVMEKCGLRYTHDDEKWLEKKGRMVPLKCYDITRTEWETMQKGA